MKQLAQFYFKFIKRFSYGDRSALADNVFALVTCLIQNHLPPHVITSNILGIYGSRRTKTFSQLILFYVTTWNTT